ncbi:MAG TPA: hypothetical protein VGZ47_07575, partial [Gemmataceae bacterium]|nr:hypothetical protein [Gemmataceae bacterium]
RFPKAEDVAAQEAYGAGNQEREFSLSAIPPSVPEAARKSANAWAAFSKARRPVWESGAADICLRQFENTALMEYIEIRKHAQSTYAAGLIGSAAPGPAIAMPASNIIFRERQRVGGSPLFLGEELGRRADWPLLAIRASRRALQVNPNDVNAYLRLGQAYLAMHNATTEGNLLLAFPVLNAIRYVQIVFALEQALKLDPDLLAAHEQLANLFVSQNYLDAALEHYQQQERLLRRDGPAPAESQDQFQKRIQQMDRFVKDLEKAVHNRQNELVIQTQRDTDPLGKARLAVSMGLAKQALDDILLKSQIELFGIPGANLQLELMLMLGRAGDVRDLLEEPNIVQNKVRMQVVSVPLASPDGRPAVHEFPAFEWFRIRCALALGDYELALSDLDTCAGLFQIAERETLPLVQFYLPQIIGAGLGCSPNCLSAAGQELVVNLSLVEEAKKVREMLLLRNQLADVYALQGMVRLEEGPGAAAKPKFEQALNVRLLAGPQSLSAGQLLSAHYWKRIVAAAGGDR